MDSEDWSGLTVRTRDGTVLGVVVGVFAQGLLAGRLRVQGRQPISQWGGRGGVWERLPRRPRRVLSRRGPRRHPPVLA
jgi:hypothetical protein